MIEHWKSFRGLFEVSNHGNPIKIYNTRYLSFRKQQTSGKYHWEWVGD